MFVQVKYETQSISDFDQVFKNGEVASKSHKHSDFSSS